MSGHTHGEWWLKDGKPAVTYGERTRGEYAVWWPDDVYPNGEADAARIVTAVNCHDFLVAALMDLLAAYSGLAAIGEERAKRMNAAETNARAALARAGGGTT